MDGVFECKTCNRRFASFQALGGHRTSHSRPKTAGGGGDEVGKTKASHVHECAICGSRFAMGQALGGHMRRHRDRGAVVQRSSQPEELDLLSVFEHGVSGNLFDYKVVGDGEECRLLQLFV